MPHTQWSRLTLIKRVLMLAMLAAGVIAAPSHAYNLGGKPWPTRTITYHAATPQYDAAIASAVAAWNASGMRVRFKAVSRRRAKLRIVYRSNSGGPAGDAMLGFIEPVVVTRRTIGGADLVGGENTPCGTRVPGPYGRPARVRCVRERFSPRIRLDKVSAAKRRAPSGA